MIRIIHRFYHLSSVSCNMKKQGIKLCKMVNPKTKRQWYLPNSLEANLLPSVNSLVKTKHEPGKRGERRLAMLNKMFMKYITDLMSTGTVAMNIVGRGIEISKVNLTPDFQTLNVFWVCKGNTTDEETEAVLKKIAGPLRHELSTLRLMGEIPYIVFVKDKHQSQVVDLDRRLALADYGEDYTPTEIGHLLKTEFTLDTKLSPEMKAKIKQIEEELSLIEEPIPEMTNNVFGLDHTKIMNRLLADRKRSREAWNSIDVDSTVITYRRPVDKSRISDVSNDRQVLADFLLKRQILQNKLHKQLRNSHKDLEVLQDDEHDDDDDKQIYDDDDDCYEDDYYYEEERIQLEKNNKDSQTTLS